METQKPKRSLTDIIKKPLIAAATLATIATSTQSCAPGMYFSVQGRDQNTAYAIAVATQPATCYDYRYIPGVVSSVVQAIIPGICMSMMQGARCSSFIAEGLMVK